MATAKEVLDVAQKYIGFVEENNNNIIFNTKYYGHPVNGAQYRWCAVFVWYVFNEVGASDIFCGGQKTALCQYALEYYRKNGKLFKTDPQPGDLVFFKFGTTSRETNHMGFVESVNADGSVNTIEGNTSDANQNNGGMVMRKKRSSGIVAYGRPSYAVETVKAEQPPIFENIYPQKGIDMAAWQTNVNYVALRTEGVKFVILKIMRRDLNPDKMFEEHYRGCQKAGIPVRAVYNYSYATTVEKARVDAHRVVTILNGRNIPVCLDVEDECLKNLGEKLPQIINAYQSVIQSAGLKFCVYSNLNFYNNFIQPYLNKLNNTQFWIARYPSKTDLFLTQNPDPAKKPNISGLVAWQYTSCGKIESAYRGKLDFDILYSPIIEQTRKTGTVTANSLRIRSTPSTKDLSNVVGYLKKNDGVVIYNTDVATGWYCISIDGNKWVSNNYIKIN